MTRQELNTELKRVDRYIEVQQILTNQTLCCGISKVQDKFNDVNIQILKDFITTKNKLKALERENDNVLKNIRYRPISYQ